MADRALVGLAAGLQSRGGGRVVVGIRLDVFPVAGFVATECLVSSELLVAYATLVGDEIIGMMRWRRRWGVASGEQHEAEGQVLILRGRR